MKMPTPFNNVSDQRRAAYAWLSEWEYRHESSLSLVLKFAWANCVQARDLCPVLFGTSTLDNRNVGSHGRTLLDAKWMTRSRSRPQGDMLNKIAAGTLGALAGRWTHKIAADTAIRFCHACLERGFHSPLFQIDGIEQCPIHRTRLSTGCPHCGADTARFAVTPEAVDTPFHCAKCLAPLAGTCDPRHWVDEWLHRATDDVLGPVAHWVRTLERSSLTWDQWENWFTPLQNYPTESERRAETLSVLLRLVPPSFDIKLLGGSRLGPKIYLGRADGARTKHFRALPARMSDCEVAARTAIYKSLRRHATKMLAGCKQVDILPLKTCAEINQSDEVMYPSMQKCPRAQALALWRLHFEHLDALGNRLRLRQAALNWPWNGQADRHAWAGYVLASLHAAVNAFDLWRSLASGLTDPHLLGEDRVKARELFTEFSAVLSPIHFPTFPAISVLQFQDLRNNFNLAIVGPASMEVNSLASCRSGQWCACTRRQQLREDTGIATVLPHQIRPILELAASGRTDHHVATEYIAPLDELKLPASLDGSCAGIDRKRNGCILAAENDIAAIDMWLDHCLVQASTRRAYRLCAEKCLIWAVAQQGKPFSSLDQSDASAYAVFLLDPQPKALWLTNGGARRSKSNWTPFKRPLAATSRDYSMRALRSLFEYWRCCGYVGLNPWTHLPFSFDGVARRDQAPMTVVKHDANSVTLAEWNFLLRVVNRGGDTSSTAATRAIVFLAYYAALKPREIVELRLRDVWIDQSGPNVSNLSSVTVRSRPPERQRVFLFPCVVESLIKFLPEDPQELELLRSRDGDLPLIDLIGSPSFRQRGNGEPADDTRPYLYLPTKPAFKAAAALACERGDDVAATRLSTASIGWLSASLEVHVRQLDLSAYALWHVLGVGRLVAPSMRNYMPRNRERLGITLSESMDQLRAVFP